MIRNRTLFPAIALSCCLCNEWPNRTGRLSLFRVPVQSIVLAFVAEQFLRILFNSLVIPRFARVLFLGIHEGVKRIDGVKLVAADSAVEDILFTSGCVDQPDAILFYERNRKWLVVSSDVQRY